MSETPHIAIYWDNVILFFVGALFGAAMYHVWRPTPETPPSE
jgi:hypothetical protein